MSTLCGRRLPPAAPTTTSGAPRAARPGGHGQLGAHLVAGVDDGIDAAAGSSAGQLPASTNSSTVSDLAAGIDLRDALAHGRRLGLPTVESSAWICRLMFDSATWSRSTSVSPRRRCAPAPRPPRSRRRRCRRRRCGGAHARSRRRRRAGAARRSGARGRPARAGAGSAAAGAADRRRRGTQVAGCDRRLRRCVRRDCALRCAPAAGLPATARHFSARGARGPACAASDCG